MNGTLVTKKAHKVLGVTIAADDEGQAQELAKSVRGLLLDPKSSLWAGVVNFEPRVQEMEGITVTPTGGSSRALLYMLLRLLLGLGAGLGLAFLLNYLDDSLRSAREVEAAVGLPVLGEIPARPEPRPGRRRRARRAGAYGLTTAGLTTLLFDLDGTLIDSMGLIFSSYRHALREVLGEEPDAAALLSIFGKPLRRSLAELAAGQMGVPLAQLLDEAAEAAPLPDLHSPDSPDDALVDRLIKTYRRHNLANHDAMVSAFPGVRPTLAELSARGYTLAVVTSKGRLTADRSMRHCGLAEFMRTSVAMEDVARHKPDPAPLRVALRRLDRQPAETLYLGDSHVDVLAAQAAGTRSAAALWGPYPRESLLALRPDHPLERHRGPLGHLPPIDSVVAVASDSATLACLVHLPQP